MRVILSHRQLDFDALASMLGAYKLYPGSVMVIEGKPSPYVQDFLSLSKDLLPIKNIKDINLEDVSKLILVDTHDISRTSNFFKNIFNRLDIDIVIYDHHPYEGTLEQGMTIEPVGACSTLLVERISSLNIPLNSFEATLLALGIYDDTGSLLFENTTVRDVQAVAYLLEQGAQLNVIAEYLRRPLTEQQKELLQSLVENGQMFNFQGTPVYITMGECSEYVGGLALLAYRIGELEGAETWFLVVNMENRVYIIGRSKSKGLPINKIVKAFGGSGHAKAASASIKNGKLSEIMEGLKAEILKFIKSPLLIRDVMTKNVHTVSPDTILSEVHQLLLRYGHTGVPVVEKGVLVGIISRRDVDKAVKHGLSHAPVKGFMSTDVISLTSDAPWEEAQRLMVEHDIGRLPIIREGQVEGIISRSDILRLIHGGAVPIGTEIVRARSSANKEDILTLIARLPKELQRLLNAASEVCREIDCKAFVVGGFVRDLLIGVPTHDLDLVVEGYQSTKFAHALIEYLGEGKLTHHPRFGTARISFNNGNHLDIAVARWEFYPYPGALPEVEESCLREDLLRRDFTINAMAICLESKHFGELVDYYGGLRDIKQGEVQFLHRLSFIDDPTRILRAIRFAIRYKFSIAYETLYGIEVALNTGVLKNLSKERFTEELFLILNEERYLEMIKSLYDLGVFRNWFGKDFSWNFQGPIISEDTFILQQRWLYIIVNITEEEIQSIIENLTLTRNLKKTTLRWLELRTRLKNLLVTNYSLFDIDYILVNESKWMVDLLILDKELQVPVQTYKDQIKKMSSVLSGGDLVNLGVPEGPRVGELIKQIRKAWLDGKIQTAFEEELYARELLKTLI